MVGVQGQESGSQRRRAAQATTARVHVADVAQVPSASNR